MIPLYIFDLDGTLALIEHRRHLLVEPICPDCMLEPTSDDCSRCGGTRYLKPDWAGFFAACVRDEPNWPVISTMMGLIQSGAAVQIWTGRSAAVMNETLAWLQRHIFGDGSVDPDEVGLTMRREGDHTPDHELKAGWHEALSEYDKRRLVAVFEDRGAVVQMWRERGVACFQVAASD